MDRDRRPLPARYPLAVPHAARGGRSDVAVELAGMANQLLDELDLPELGSGGIVELGLMLGGVAATIITVVGQRRDGRWSRGTQAAGGLSVGVYALVIPFNLLLGRIFSGGRNRTADHGTDPPGAERAPHLHRLVDGLL
ncbi:hypothetical protein [Nonomuraea jabiensis]|uniref:hypothetical protein n=1 Tax=Nonomuraea jabiensis TaxID=882448 RepID=UPI0036BAB08E